MIKPWLQQRESMSKIKTNKKNKEKGTHNTNKPKLKLSYMLGKWSTQLKFQITVIALFGSLVTVTVK